MKERAEDHRPQPVAFPQTIRRADLFMRLIIKAGIVALLIALIFGAFLSIEPPALAKIFTTTGLSLLFIFYAIAVADYWAKKRRFRDAGIPIRLGVDSFQSKIVAIPKWSDDLETIAHDSLRRIGEGCDVVSPQPGLFVCEKGRTSGRPATRIAIEIRRSPDSTELVLTSHASEWGFPGDKTIFDYGESIDNILRLKEELMRRLRDRRSAEASEFRDR